MPEPFHQQFSNSHTETLELNLDLEYVEHLSGGVIDPKTSPVIRYMLIDYGLPKDLDPHLVEYKVQHHNYDLGPTVTYSYPNPNFISKPMGIKFVGGGSYSIGASYHPKNPNIQQVPKKMVHSHSASTGTMQGGAYDDLKKLNKAAQFGALYGTGTKTLANSLSQVGEKAKEMEVKLQTKEKVEVIEGGDATYYSLKMSQDGFFALNLNEENAKDFLIKKGFPKSVKVNGYDTTTSIHSKWITVHYTEPKIPSQIYMGLDLAKDANPVYLEDIYKANVSHTYTQAVYQVTVSVKVWDNLISVDKKQLLVASGFPKFIDVNKVNVLTPKSIGADNYVIQYIHKHPAKEWDEDEFGDIKLPKKNPHKKSDPSFFLISPFMSQRLVLHGLAEGAEIIVCDKNHTTKTAVFSTRGGQYLGQVPYSALPVIEEYVDIPCQFYLGPVNHDLSMENYSREVFYKKIET